MPRVSVKCAAAAEEEVSDEEEEDDHWEKKKRQRVDDGGSSARKQSNAHLSGTLPAASTVEPPQKKKKAKEFAWMDSDDEDDGEDKASDEDDAVQDEHRVVKRVSADNDESEATLERLNAVETFGRMMLISESLLLKLKKQSLTPEEVAASCRALGRSKFYDSDVLDELGKLLPKMLESKKLSVEQANDALAFLRELNVYNKDICNSITKTFKDQASLMPQALRHSWLDLLRSFGHDQDKEFLQLLQAPPLIPGTPNYKTIRCEFFVEGCCESGALCTYAHSMQAPISLADAGKEDGWRSRPTMLTQGQMYSVGNDAYCATPLK